MLFSSSLVPSNPLPKHSLKVSITTQIPFHNSLVVIWSYPTFNWRQHAERTEHKHGRDVGKFSNLRGPLLVKLSSSYLSGRSKKPSQCVHLNLVLHKNISSLTTLLILILDRNIQRADMGIFSNVRDTTFHHHNLWWFENGSQSFGTTSHTKNIKS